MSTHAPLNAAQAQLAARLLDALGRAEEAADVRATLRRDFPDSEAARSLGE